MKILITDIHHGNGGGHVTYVMSLLKGLKDDADLTIAAPPTGRLYRYAAGLPGVRVLPGLYTSRPLSLFSEVRLLRRFLKQERFDIIHVNGGADHRHIMLASLGLRHRPAIVWTKHNTNPVSSLGHRLRAKFGTHISIAVCDYVARMLSESNYRRHPIHVVRNGIDIDSLRPVTASVKHDCRQQLFGTLSDAVVVLRSIGGTDYNKGWLVLAEAISRLDPDCRSRFRMVVAGDPPSQEMLDKVALLGLQNQLVFPGLVKDVRTVLAACDIGFVLSYREAASYASCETMAMGLPALVSDAGGLPENVRDGLDGWVVPAGDVDALVRLLNQVSADPSCLSEMGQSARTRVEQVFSTPSFLEGTKKVYEQARDLVRKLPAPI
ncbi:lipopolysaccharide core biosynthesis glycosyl transferase [Pollutimonas nitritireducens]|uniref:Lipopolysaccharide core biosynthesis glycosyl transferase n=1 Tax=Pollutimonas nitritireducens TaxID=2045209 RepID=A0A2N4UJ94_9BURK|nr:glycosyltransferase family 4 protein [Pollutimonas nitritireducens]PLC55104.1 lipopolysaccharide core biosynthesis glycosyl transferase [Pollutimonas nitritireducens]